MAYAIRIHAHGDPSVLRYEPVEVDAPGPGQAKVRHVAIGLNYIDTYHRSGLYPLPTLPSGLGVEGAGVVEAVGPNVTGLVVGDRVAYAGGAPGSYASERLIMAERLVKLPDALTFEQAAASMLKGMTVEYLIRRTYPVRPGQTVLFHAAAGGVGLIACQWLRHLGVRVIGTVGSNDKAELARAHGCTETIVYTRENFVERVGALTEGKGVPVVYDSVGRDTFAGSLDCLEPRGMLVSFGNASGKPEPLDINLLSTKGALYVTRPTLFHYTTHRAELEQSSAAVFDVLLSGVVKLRVSASYPLAAARAAHEDLEGRRTTGSVVLVPGG
jgi:NADPH:quinone reductase